MSEIKSESISSLVDNCSPSSDDNMSAHLVDKILKDEHLSDTWQNYHLIGDVLRDEVPQSLELDLSQTIADAIAQEATILSPKLSPNSAAQPVVQHDDESLAVTSEDVQTKSNVSNTIVDATNRFKAKVSSFVKPVGQIAIAASAAGLMIVGVQSNVANNTVTPSQVVQTVPLAGYANPVSFSVQSEPSFQSQQQAQQAMSEQAAKKVAQQRRLQALLQDHNFQSKLGNNN